MCVHWRIIISHIFKQYVHMCDQQTTTIDHNSIGCASDASYKDIEFITQHFKCNTTILLFWYVVQQEFHRPITLIICMWMCYHLCVNRNVFNEIGKSTSNNICKCQQNIQFHIEFHNVVQCNCCQLFISHQTTTNVPTIVTNHSSTTKYNCFMWIEQETIIHRKHRSNNCHSCCNDFQHIIHCDIQW